MPNWNGMSVSVEAHKIALNIQRATGHASLPESYPVKDAVKTMLRNFYLATGGKRGRGPDCYEPSARELRRIYNGAVSGAAVLKSALNRGDAIEVAEEVVTEAAGPEAEALAALQKLLGGGQKIDPEAVKKIAVDAVNGRVGEVMSSMAAIITDEVQKQVRTVKVQIAGKPEVKIDKAHKMFDVILTFCANRENVLIVGGAGGGKTFLAEQIAKALGLDYYFSGRTEDKTDVKGYMDGGGTYRTTAFRQAFEFGGLFLFDEMDGWTSEALLAINAPLAGEWGDFPDGKVRRHPDFVAIGAGNTYGRGADRQYVGREQLDAASMDRFAVVEFDYDEDLELAISCNREWTLWVQKVRAAVEKEKIRHLVTPRASIKGGIMLAAGLDRKIVENAYIWKGLDETVKNRVLAAMR